MNTHHVLFLCIYQFALADLGEGTALLILGKMKSQEEEKQAGKVKKKKKLGPFLS